MNIYNPISHFHCNLSCNFLWWAPLLGFEMLKTSLASTSCLKRAASWGLVVQCGLSVLFGSVVAPWFWFWPISSIVVAWPGSNLQIRFSLWWERICTFLIWGRGGLPSWCSGKEPEFAYWHRRCRFNSLIGKIPWRKKWQSTPVFLPGKSCGQRGLVGYVPWVSKRQTRLSTHTHARWANYSKSQNRVMLFCSHFDRLMCIFF